MSWVEWTSVGAWDLGKEMLENGENHDRQRVARWLARWPVVTGPGLFWPKRMGLSWFSPVFYLFLSKSQAPTHLTSLNHDMLPHSLSYLILCPISLILSFIFSQSFRSEGKLGHLGLLGLETCGPWEDSTEDYLFSLGTRTQTPTRHILDTLGVQTTSDSNVPSGYRLGTF